MRKLSLLLSLICVWAGIAYGQYASWYYTITNPYPFGIEITYRYTFNSDNIGYTWYELEIPQSSSTYYDSGWTAMDMYGHASTQLWTGFAQQYMWFNYNYSYYISKTNWGTLSVSNVPPPYVTNAIYGSMIVQQPQWSNAVPTPVLLIRDYPTNVASSATQLPSMIERDLLATQKRVRYYSPNDGIYPTNGLVSYYQLNTNVYDLVGTNQTTATNAITFTNGLFNGAVTYSVASTGFIFLTNSASLDTTNFTWMAWCYPVGPPPQNDGGGMVLFGHLYDEGGSHSYGVSWKQSPDNRFIANTGTGAGITSSNLFPPGAAYNVAYTYDGTAFRLYVNGSLQGIVTNAASMVYDAGTPWYVGSDPQIFINVSYPRTWVGTMEELRFYNRALAASEITNCAGYGGGFK